MGSNKKRINREEVEYEEITAADLVPEQRKYTKNQLKKFVALYNIAVTGGVTGGVGIFRKGEGIREILKSMQPYDENYFVLAFLPLGKKTRDTRKLIGFVNFKPYRYDSKKDFYYWEFAHGKWAITYLCISNLFRRMGIGGDLVAKMVAYWERVAGDAKDKSLHTLVEPEIYSIYEKNGFKKGETVTFENMFMPHGHPEELWKIKYEQKKRKK